MVDESTNTSAPAQKPDVSTPAGPSAEELARQEAQAATEAAEAASRAAALAADLDDLPSAAAPQSLEQSFTPAASITPVTPVEAPAPVVATLPEMPAFTQAPQPEPAAAPVSAPDAPAPAAEVPAAPLDLTPSKPQENGMKRRVREKTPRNFAFVAPVLEAAASSAPAAEEAVEQTPTAAQPDEQDTWSPVATGTLPEAPAAPAAFANVPATAPQAPAAPVAAPAAPEEPMSWSVPEAPAEKPSVKPVVPPMGSLSQQAEEAPAPASDLPWVNNAADDAGNDGWQVDAPGASASPYGTTESGSASAPLDIYGGLGNATSTTTAGIPPFMAATGGTAPELPKSSARAQPAKVGSSNTIQWAAGALVVAVVGFAAFQLVKNDESQERVARLTGALTETTEKLPPELGGAQANPNADLVAPEQVIAMGDMQATGVLPPPPATTAEGGTFQPLQPVLTSATGSGAMIDFADVPSSQANEKIVGDSNQPMPDDIGLIAKFQQAVADEKARQSGTPATAAVTPDATTPAIPADSPGLTPAQKEAQNLALQAKLEAELAAYRQTLASSETPAAAPKPTDFFKNPGQFTGEAPVVPASTATPLQPPVATTAEAGHLAPNPNNLPILPEPTAVQEPQIRQLSDFSVDVFQPEEDRVRIPKGIRPRFASTDFPEMEVLSFVPGRGVIAFNRGREGVLLIGESLEGWELMSVGVDKAEFRNGRRVQYVSADQ